METQWEEMEQLKVALAALKTQNRDAQIRMLAYLSDRLASDHEEAMKEREKRAREKIAKA